MGVLNFKDQKVSGEDHFLKYITANFNLNTVFDVGANAGNYSAFFVNTKSRVYSFEPHPVNFQAIKKRFQENDNISTFELGLSDTSGKLMIYDYEGNDGSAHASMLKGVFTSIHQSESKASEVTTTTIDEFITEHNIEKIDLLKIDTEGNELQVLEGAKKAIGDGKIDIVQFEFNQMNIISKSFLGDFINCLSDYNIYRLLPGGFHKIDYKGYGAIQYEIFAFQNIVAFRKAIDKIK